MSKRRAIEKCFMRSHLTLYADVSDRPSVSGLVSKFWFGLTLFFTQGGMWIRAKQAEGVDAM